MKRITNVFICLLCILASFCGCSDNEELERQIREYRQNKFTIYAEENEKYEDFEVDAAFLGDSLTDLYDLEKHYPQYVVSNRGIGADTTVGLEERLPLSLYDLKPKVALMLIGVNNIGSMFDNYESILAGFKKNVPNTKIILLSLTSMSGDWGKNNHLAAYNNVKIKLLAEKYGFEYVDLYSVLINLESGEISSEYTTDGCHLTTLGYEVLTREITPAIEKQLSIWKLENQQG
jgi:lysophospholipase L1-like esterase